MTPADTRRFLAAAGLLATLDGAAAAEPVTPPGVTPPPVLDVPIVPAAAPLPPLPVLQLPPADPKPIDTPKPIPLPVIAPPAAGPVEVLPPPLIEKKAEEKPIAPPAIDPPKLVPPPIDPPKFDPPKLGPPAAEPPALPSPFAPAQPAPPAKSDVPSAPAPSPPAENNLQPAGPRLNVKPESAEPPKSVPAVPTALSRPPEPEPPPSGDAPVLPVRKLTMSAVLGTALAVTPVVAQDGANKKDDTAKVAAPTAEDMTALRNEVKQLREMLQGKTESGITKVGLAERVEKLERKLDTLDDTLKRIEGKLDTARTSGSSPVAGGTTTAGNGTVTVVNEYPVEVSIVINGVSRRLDPSQKKEFTVPAGTFKYWLLGGSGEEKSRAIKENENVSLWIR